MGNERPKGPLPESWRPGSAVQRALYGDIIERLNQHRREDTLPRSPRGLFYDLRPSGFGRGLSYVKQPATMCIRGEHLTVGRCRVHSRPGSPAPNRKVNPVEMSPADVQSVLVLMRRAGIVPESWIEDTRAPHPDVPYYNDESAEDYAAGILASIDDPGLSYSPQRGQGVYLEVLVEAAGLIGRLARIARPYGVPVYSGGGYDGLKGKRALAERAYYRDVPTIVLRITDWDRDGRVMADSAFRDSHAWLTEHYGGDPEWLEVERIALTEAQAADNDLLDASGKAEADGLPVPVMDAILTGTIEGYQDPDVRQQNIDEAEAEASRVRNLVLTGLNGESED